MKKFIPFLSLLLVPLGVLASQVTVPSAPAAGYTPVSLSTGNYTIGIPTASASAPDYIVSTTGGVASAVKTRTNTVIASDAATDVVLNAISADAPSTGASIAVKSGTYYLNATSTFNGLSDLVGTTWKIIGAGQGTTNFVVNNSADAFYFHGSVKANVQDMTFYLKDGANGITASSTFGFRSVWNSNFSNLMFQGTTSLSTGWGLNLVDDDHNVYNNLFIQGVGNCFRSATDGEGKFNPGDATLSNIHCSFGAPSNAGGSAAADNTFQTGVGYYFDGSATQSSTVNQDTLINVLASDNHASRTAFRFNRASNNHGVSVESEGFATTSETYNHSKANQMVWEYVIGNKTGASNVYFYYDDTSINNANLCTFIDASAIGNQPLFVDSNNSATEPNVLAGNNEGVCELTTLGQFTFATTSRSVIRKVQGGSLGNEYNGVLVLPKRLEVGSTTPISGGLNFELQGNAAEVYGPGVFSSLRAAIVNTNLTQSNFADFDLDMYDASQNQITTGIRMMAIFDHTLAQADFALVSGSFEISRFTKNGNLGLSSTTPFGTLTVGSSTSIKGVAGVEATSTIFLDSSPSKGGCIIMKDTDGIGYTYVIANNGVLSASQTPCL